MKACLLLACLPIVTIGFAQSTTIPDTTSKPAYVARYRDDKTCAISYTFDDGLQEHYSLVAPAMNKLGLKATFVINGSKINRDNNTITDTTRMTWPELKEVAAAGHEISNHGWAHLNFGRFPLDSIKEDVRKNDSAIFANIGILPRSFAYPNNTKSKEGVQWVSQNRVGTRTFQHSVGGKVTLESLESWVDTLLLKHDWGVTMTHGITYGYDYFKTPEVLWQHLQQVKQQEDKIWVGTFREVAAYIREREAIQLQITQGRTGLLITPQLALDKELFAEPLTLIIPRKGNQPVKAMQDKKTLAVSFRPGKAFFSFNPYGGAIQVLLK